MPKTVDEKNDGTVVPETAYQDNPKPVSSGSKSRSLWVIAVLAALLIGLALFVGLGRGSHTDPAPYGGTATNGSSAQPAPTQNSN